MGSISSKKKSIIDISPEDILSKLKGANRFFNSDNSQIGVLNDKWILSQSNRRGVMRRLENFFLKKIYSACKSFLYNILKEQEKYNKQVETILSTIISMGEFDIDFDSFENRFRGTEEEVEEDLKDYVKYFCSEGPVLDVGCGRGEFLRCLKRENISALGLDWDEYFVDKCKGEGFDTSNANVNVFLSDLDDSYLAGISCFRVIEHMDKINMLRFLKNAYKKLKSGGVLLIETPNPTNLSTFTDSFYIYPTRLNPVHPETLRFLASMIGFEEIEIKFKNYVNDERKLSVLEDMSEVEKANIDKLNGILFSAQDYLLIAKK